MKPNLNPGLNRVRCRIELQYKGKDYIYCDPIDSLGSQYLWLGENGNVDPSTFWWTEMGCDCNRRYYLPDKVVDSMNPDQCGHEIRILKIVPLIDNAPVEWILDLTNDDYEVGT